ncbi:MAG TPA: DUF1801 domain-containing protein [Chitinophaga sp.]|uniref:iron chaperone n=1 Tax=Chitinophaga sp. TaxID=1869181 RepID=UPI002DBD3974|nr:DUF1801 domain-containing protein [Chitinophaga sp.]HEU4554356.1 DUF1801 domain-containing protein [Chitinophaga sp.]
MPPSPPTSIDAYIADFPAGVQSILQEIRTTVQQAVPQAEATIKYAMPTFTLNGRNLVHFAAFKKHIGFYPVPQGSSPFEQELSRYKQGRGSVQFPLNQPIPLDLIARLVKYLAKRTNT